MFRLFFKPVICQNIFGWDSFVEYYPKLLEEGLPVKLINNRYYVFIDNAIVNDGQFFTQNEVKEYCTLHEVV